MGAAGSSGPCSAAQDTELRNKNMPRATKPPPALPLPVTGPPTPVTSFLLSSALERGVGGLLPFGDRMRNFHSKENIRNFSPPGASPSLGFGENGRWLCAPFCQPQLLQARTLPHLLLALAGDRHLQTCPKTWRYGGSWGFVRFQSTWWQGGRPRCLPMRRREEWPA